MKKRLDELLLERGYFESLAKAQGAIMAGIVMDRNGYRLEKAGLRVAEDIVLDVRLRDGRYASRGGLKLERALAEFRVELTGKTVLDVGSSTGGFTDCALRHGAARVIAVDSGTNQLVWRLRNDPRVKVLEQTNFRHMIAADLGGLIPTVALIDVSFISLALIFPNLWALLPEGAHVVALVKPQFEAPISEIEAGGLVTNREVWRRVLEKATRAAAESGFRPLGLIRSPIEGMTGNREFLLHASRETSRNATEVEAGAVELSNQIAAVCGP
ncbi:MAG: TlyA family RNA methyltransferase [Sumerlaeia bacterium]